MGLSIWIVEHTADCGCGTADHYTGIIFSDREGPLAMVAGDTADEVEERATAKAARIAADAMLENLGLGMVAHHGEQN